MLLSVSALPTSAADSDESDTIEPDVDVFVPDNRVLSGQDAEIGVFLSNDVAVSAASSENGGRRSGIARGVSVELESGEAPLEVKTDRTPVGTVPSGRVGPVTFGVTVREDAEPGVYQVPVEVNYTYSERADYYTNRKGRTVRKSPDDLDEEHVTETHNVTIVVEDRAQFDVVETETDVTVGDTGQVSLTLKNTGHSQATDSTVTVQSQDRELHFVGSTSSQSFAGAWEAGETKTVQYKVQVANTSLLKEYALDVDVTFDDEDGVARQSLPMTAGVRPRPEQTFAIRDVRANLSVGDDGDLVGEVVNTGPTTVENAVVLYASDNPNVIPKETEYTLGTLEPNESASFDLRMEIREETDAGTRQLTFRTRYRNRNGDRRTSDPLDADVVVDDESDAFAVEPGNATFSPGSSASYRVELTNTANRTLTDVRPRLFTSSPISTADDTAFVDELEPGETATVEFGLDVGDGAREKTYSVSMDVVYDDESNNELSDAYRLPVDVTDSDARRSMSMLPLAGAFGVVALTGAGLFWKTTRRDE